MRSRQLVFGAVIVAAAALVVVLAFRNRHAPPLPADAAHAVFLSAEACLACHGPGTTHPRGKNHPVGRDCTRCHGR